MGHFNAVYASQDIDGIGTEYSNAGHIDVVKRTQVEQFAEIWSKGKWYDNAGYAKVYEVDNKDGYSSKGRNKELMPPSNIKEVIADAEN